MTILWWAFVDVLGSGVPGAGASTCVHVLDSSASGTRPVHLCHMVAVLGACNVVSRWPVAGRPQNVAE